MESLFTAMMRRRSFIQYAVGLSGIGWLLAKCSANRKRVIPGAVIGASAAAGHLLRDNSIQSEPVSTEYIGVAIIGGGISGLSAARWLHRSGRKDFVVFDLEKKYGGNAASGRNEISAYPWGAHYVPLPNNNLEEYLSFLQECNVVAGYNEQGLPVYNEYYLCFEPEERLFINGSWQNGLVPHLGVPAKENEEIRHFMQQMEVFRQQKGKDGKDAFAIPVNDSSQDEEWKQLDSITMKEWLLQHNYTSSYLHWYANYCCRDDFGTRYDETSAWAGIHYFAGRKGIAANAKPNDVITWPQGNAWLAEQLCKDYQDKIQVSSVVLSVEHVNDKVAVKYYDLTGKQVKKLVADKCVICTPQFVTQRLLKQFPERQSLVQQHFSYSPWMVANITTDSLAERNGEPLSWDNVVYGSESLGYVEATHQLLEQLVPVKVLTYYRPLTKADPVTERKQALQRTQAEWAELILQELEPVHEDIREKVKHIDVMVWGHAMIQPGKNFVYNEARHLLSQPVNNCIFFAHTDLAGISIFEEGFYQGIRAAQLLLQSV
ncbi:MAG: FAD-dependent oxidoreductase [Chitinophagaceae bacterium]